MPLVNIAPFQIVAVNHGQNRYWVVWKYASVLLLAGFPLLPLYLMIF